MHMIYLLASSRYSITSPPAGLLPLAVSFLLVKAAALLFLFFIPAETGTVLYASLKIRRSGLKSRCQIPCLLNIFILSLLFLIP